MNSHALVAGLFLLLCLGFVQAEEFAAPLVKVADGKVTFTRGIGKNKQDITLPAEKCRVFLAKYDKINKKIDAGDELAGGLKNPLFEKLQKDTIEAWICTNEAGDKILELRIYQSAKKAQ
jgi:hypothetical protein